MRKVKGISIVGIIAIALLAGIPDMRADTIAWTPNVKIEHSFGCESPFIIKSIATKKTNGVTITTTGEETNS